MAERKGWRKTITWRVVSAFAALAVAATVLTGTGADTVNEAAQAAPGDPPPAVQCNTDGSLLPIRLWRWACPGGNGNFWSWWVNPNVWQNPHLDEAEQQQITSKINATGNVTGANDSLGETRQATIDYIFAVGSRGIPSVGSPLYPKQWDPAAAGPVLDRYVAPGGTSATAWLEQDVAAACPEYQGSVALAAKAGLALAMVGSATTHGDCNLQDIVQNSLDPATGQFGAGVEDTVWAAIATVAWGTSLGYDGSVVIDYLEANKNDKGAWGPPGVVDFELTSLAVQAILGLGVTAADTTTFEGPVQAVAAEQITGTFNNKTNDFGGPAGEGQNKLFCGFGDKESGNLVTTDTAHVHGMMKALANNAQEYWSYLEPGTHAGGRDCVQHALGNVLQNQARNLDGDNKAAALEDPLAEGRFYVDLSEKEGLSFQSQQINDGEIAPDTAPPTINGEIDPAITSQPNNTRPTTVTMFYTYFFHPVETVSADTGVSAVPDQNVPTATEATPTVTG